MINAAAASTAGIATSTANIAASMVSIAGTTISNATSMHYGTACLNI